MIASTPSVGRFYNSPEWNRLRVWHRRHNPICAVRGCGKPVFMVDHIVPVSVAPERALDPSNVQSLCQGCHNRITRAYDLGSIRGACDDDGNPSDPSHPWLAVDNAAATKAANTKAKVNPMVAARLKRIAVRGRR